MASINSISYPCSFHVSGFPTLALSIRLQTSGLASSTFLTENTYLGCLTCHILPIRETLAASMPRFTALIVLVILGLLSAAGHSHGIPRAAAPDGLPEGGPALDRRIPAVVYTPPVTKPAPMPASPPRTPINPFKKPRPDDLDQPPRDGEDVNTKVEPEIDLSNGEENESAPRHRAGLASLAGVLLLYLLLA